MNCVSKIQSQEKKINKVKAKGKEVGKKTSSKKKKCFRPGSNRGPCACEAHVITATLRKQLTASPAKLAFKGLGLHVEL